MANTYRVERWNERNQPNPAMLRHIMVTEGFTAYQWGDSPGSIHPMHKHANDQSHWIISGSIEFNVERYGTVILQAGDRDFMPAGTYHSARVLGEEHVTYLVGEK